MLKKVTLTNIHSQRAFTVLVDTDDDAKAIFGAGQAPNETAAVKDITGADEIIERATSAKPNLEETVAFFSGMARCLERNLSVAKSLQLMAPRLKSPRYRGAVADIASKIAAGERLSDAFAAHPDIFPEETVALLRAGEESGQISEIFKQITSGRQKSLRILRKLKGGMIYPAIVLVLAVAVVIIMAFTLIPAISKLYTAMNAQLPLATQVMIKFSEILISQPYLVLLPIAALWMFFKNWSKIYRTPAIQRFITALPTVGNIVRKTAAMVSFRALALLLQANVRIVTALEITAKTANHVDFEEFFLKVRDHIVEGMSLPESFLMESWRLGPDGRVIAAVVQMAGETGGVNEMLDEIATDYEEDLDAIAAQIDKIMEPITLVMMGVIVGFLIYAIYGPIFNLSKVILPKSKPAAGAAASP